MSGGCYANSAFKDPVFSPMPSAWFPCSLLCLFVRPLFAVCAGAVGSAIVVWINVV